MIFSTPSFPQLSQIPLAFFQERVILVEGLNAQHSLKKDRLGNKEVMPMTDSSKLMGHQVVVSRLCAGTVL